MPVRLEAPVDEFVTVDWTTVDASGTALATEGVDFEADSGDQWTVPIGIGIGKTVQLGKVPVRFMLEYYGSVQRPDTVGMTHNLRFLAIPAVPAGLIPFL